MQCFSKGFTVQHRGCYIGDPTGGRLVVAGRVFDPVVAQFIHVISLLCGRCRFPLVFRLPLCFMFVQFIGANFGYLRSTLALFVWMFSLFS